MNFRQMREVVGEMEELAQREARLRTEFPETAHAQYRKRLGDGVYNPASDGPEVEVTRAIRAKHSDFAYERWASYMRQHFDTVSIALFNIRVLDLDFYRFSYLLGVLSERSRHASQSAQLVVSSPTGSTESLATD